MARCLMCDKDKNKGDLYDLLSDDPLCHECRSSWERRDIHFSFHGIPLRSSYIYNQAFASCLIQYKECSDEALKDVFLYGLVHQLHQRYHGYTLLLMPSTPQKEEQRGFNHLQEMFAPLNLPMLSPFTTRSDQKNKTRTERLSVGKQIQLKPDCPLPRKILLVDDTMTTGATITGALQCLNNSDHKIQIYCLSVNKTWISYCKPLNISLK